MPKPTLDAVLDELTARGFKPKRSGDGWASRCPAHGDRNPSLSISGDDEKVLVYCHAGCSFDEVMDALGLGKTETLPARTNPAPRTKREKRKPAEPTELPRYGIHYTYENRAGEPVLVVIRKDSPEGKRYQQWTPAKDKPGLWVPRSKKPPRPLYGLPGLLKAKKGESRIVVVEGEKCADAVRRKWPGQICTTWAGGTKTVSRTNWKPLFGHLVTVVSDADDDGRKAARQIAELLAKNGSDVRIGLPDGEDGRDIADWIEAGEVDTILGEIIRPYESRSEPAPDLIKNAHYRLLGLDGDGLAFISQGSLLHRSRESVCTPRTLVAIAPKAWWESVAKTEGLGTRAALDVGNLLLRAAEEIGMADLAKLYGRGAVRDDRDRVVFHLGDRLRLEDGTEGDLESRPGIWLREPRIELTESATAGERVALRDALMAYRWKSPEDGKRILGWIAAAVAGGALEWRPHILFVAPASSGKSWILQEVVGRVLDGLAEQVVDASVPGLARLTGAGGLPIVIDEAEIEQAWVQALIPLLRATTSGSASRIRADTGTTSVVRQRPRFCALISATTVPALKAADVSRLALVRLSSKRVDNWPKVFRNIMDALKRPDRLRPALIRETPEIVQAARDITTDLQAEGMPSREALAAGALSAGWQWWGGAGIVTTQAAQSESADAVVALQTILAIAVRTGGGMDKPVSALVLSDLYAAEVADKIGVRMDDDNETLMIAGAHRGLAAALKRTDLERIGLQELLLQLDGARLSDHPRRFGSTRHRAVLIGSDTLSLSGVDLQALRDDQIEMAPKSQEPYAF